MEEEEHLEANHIAVEVNNKPVQLIPNNGVAELSNGLSNGSGSGEPFQGYAVQRMPQGLAKELVSSSTGSGNSGGLGALVGSALVGTGSLGSKGGSGGKIK